MDAREQRGLVIAALCKLDRKGAIWSVPSQTDTNKRYAVDPQLKTCTCPDHQEAGFCCKHIFAVEFTMKREVSTDGTVTETKSIVFTEKKKYRQNWVTYNAAQTIEKSRFQVLLADLCAGVAEPEQSGKGRPRLPVCERLFAGVLKIYSTFSSRRFASDLADAKERGYVQNTMHFNQVCKYLQDSDSTEPLRQLIIRSAMPLRAIETNFAVDSSGFTTSRFYKWYDEKWSGKERSSRDWVKCHVICGTKTGIVCDAQVTDRDTNDCPLLPALVKTTAKRFKIGDVTADKGYLSADNVDAIHEAGGTAFIAPKINTTGAAGGLFEKMVHYYMYRRDEFLTHYHQRSNVEALFSAIKRKFGDNVRSKTDTAMRNEVLAKVVCHNLCTVIKSQMELGIEAEFWPEDDGPKDVLRMPVRI
jgi:transposase